MRTGALTPDSVTPGRTLAAARTERGMSISEVAQRLKFSLRHIEALESDRYDVLPSGPYVRGMVRTYARLLGVDPTPLLDVIPRSGTGSEFAMQPKDMSVPFPQGPQSGSRVYLLLSMVIVVAVAVVLAEWFIRSQRDVPQDSALPVLGGETMTSETTAKVEPSLEPVSSRGDSGAKTTQPATEDAARQPDPKAEPMPLASELNVSATQTETGSPLAAAASPDAASATTTKDAASATTNQAAQGGSASGPAGAPAPLPEGRSRLTFNFELESWVEIRAANGEVLFAGVNPAGTSKEIVGTAPFTMVIGNASGVRLTRNGVPVELPSHRPSDVARLTLE